ncbi:MAG: hypothetical protein LBL81_04110 [Tannerella sp.]|jgi:hypothetical protein|nr:hypothetical protein [Tannerella sp.]
MHIANPIYDVAFRYLMADKRAAKVLISAIIGEKIETLDFSAQERPIPRNIPGKELAGAIAMTVARYDFSAQIKTADGRLKSVEIELQKAKLPSDILRFRNYIGMQYQEDGNTYTDEKGEKQGRDLYFIFILGYDVGAKGCPVIRYDGKATDVTTGESFRNEFAESLHHRSWIIQINQLKERRRNDLEKLLSIFDQSQKFVGDKHFLDVEEDDTPGMPEGYAYLLRCLRKAGETNQVRKIMTDEDFYLNDLRDSVELIGKQKRALAEKDEALAEKSKALAEQEKANERKNIVIEEKDKTIEALRKELQALRKPAAK